MTTLFEKRQQLARRRLRLEELLHLRDATAVAIDKNLRAIETLRLAIALGYADQRRPKNQGAKKIWMDIGV